ncbi:hypothetical protein LTR49_024393 [Elasticomyces elasticus]|nr:hypothetical protein LTR49_024393 [Elasticomyces elasticus]KAK5745081.1 hypothetical protein LTS12_023235 [Elasticomyces elasticus]
MLISSQCVEGIEELTIEESLHSTHRVEIAAYIEKLTTTTGEGRRRTRAQWLTPNTSWATICVLSETLGKGRARDEQEADVLYCTAADFVVHARAGKLFRKPLVIKEKFADHGMHTVELFLTLLQESCSQSGLDVQTINTKEKVPMEIDALVDLARRPSSVEHGLAVTNLLNLTKAHRPLFTMLPRFRVLETLSERLQGNAGTKMESVAVDSSWHVGFNNLALSGAFSGPEVNALCGIWLRNLEGIKYWMIISEASMASEWEAFKDKGDEWLPGGRERLIVLEKDDVLLVPPGLRVVHAVHSPVTCLTEGGMLWDEVSILETLRTIAWTRESGVMTNEDMSHRLPRIINNLKRLVRARANKLRGSQGNFGALGVYVRGTILRSNV